MLGRRHDLALAVDLDALDGAAEDEPDAVAVPENRGRRRGRIGVCQRGGGALLVGGGGAGVIGLRG
jgi:hypothetical protein